MGNGKGVAPPAAVGAGVSRQASRIQYAREPPSRSLAAPQRGVRGRAGAGVGGPPGLRDRGLPWRRGPAGRGRKAAGFARRGVELPGDAGRAARRHPAEGEPRGPAHWSLPAPGAHRYGRDGRGLLRPRYEAEPPRRDQAPAPRGGGGSGSPGTVQPRSADPGVAQSSAHRADLRPRRRRWRPGPGDGAGRRSDARRSHRERGDPDRRGAVDRQADRGGSRSGARARDHPSGPEAREHQGPRGRHGEGAGLRPREGPRSHERRGCGCAELADAQRASPRRPASSSARRRT